MSAARRVLAGPWRAAWRAWRLVQPAAPGSFRILLLHDIPQSQRKAFARLIGDLARRGRLIDPAEAERRLEGGGGPPGILLSFDDGFVSNRAVADAVLAPLGIKALFFVCPGLAELSGDAQARAISANVLRGRRPAPEPVMGWDDLERLRAAGHTIGSHTLDHVRLAGLSRDAQAEQVGRAAELLDSRLGGPHPWFAYTFGDVDSIDAAALAEVGRHHRWCRSGVRGTNQAGVAPLALRADGIDLGQGLAWARLAAEGGLDPLYRSRRHRLDAMANQV